MVLRSIRCKHEATGLSQYLSERVQVNRGNYLGLKCPIELIGHFKR